MPLMYTDRASSFTQEFQSADAIEIQGVAEFCSSDEERFSEIDNERPEYFCVYLHDKNGGTHDILDCSNYAMTVEYAEDLARFGSLPIYNYVVRKIPDPCQRNRPSDTDANLHRYDELTAEYLKWLEERKFPEMCVSELMYDAEHLLEDTDREYLAFFVDRWKKIGGKVDLASIETTEEGQYF